MPKKKKLRQPNNNGKINNTSCNRDVTIYDSADAPKVVRKLKKSAATVENAALSELSRERVRGEHDKADEINEPVEPASPIELSWDQLQDEEFDIVEKTNEDGTRNFIYKKNKNNYKNKSIINNSSGIAYPEIVWYWVSKFIKPEDVGRFAGINRATYAITRQESFWRLLYKKFCDNHPNLPHRLRLENSYKTYGLRQRVIRALFHTYDVFVKKITQQAVHDSKPHQLVKRCCVNVWFHKGPQYWTIYFKLKKLSLLQRLETDFIKELGRVDANPEENSQVLQVTCQSLYEVPPLMGMTLSSVSVLLSQGFRHHRLHLGFNTGSHNVSRDILPECTVIIDTVVSIVVFDWWHPKYPHFDNELPSNMRDEEALPVLKKDFFTSLEND